MASNSFSMYAKMLATMSRSLERNESADEKAPRAQKTKKGSPDTHGHVLARMRAVVAERAAGSDEARKSREKEQSGDSHDAVHVQIPARP